MFTAPWVKVYLVSGKRCLAKAKTATARRTLDPLYQQQLVFHEKYSGCVLQVNYPLISKRGQFKFAKLKDKEYTINAPSFYTALQQIKMFDATSF